MYIWGKVMCAWWARAPHLDAFTRLQSQATRLGAVHALPSCAWLTISLHVYELYLYEYN